VSVSYAFLKLAVHMEYNYC